MATTIDTITDEQIEALLSEQDGSDLPMTAICQIALYGYAEEKVIRQLSRAEKDSIDALCPTQGSARSECARVIAEAEAMNAS
jgi:hypothetical protein